MREKINWFANADYIDALFQQYRQDPMSVSDQWRKIFSESVDPELIESKGISDLHKQWIEAYTMRGHLYAAVNPLVDAVCDIKLEENIIDNKIKNISLKEVKIDLERTYCGSIGTEYMHILDQAERQWIYDRLEQNDMVSLEVSIKKKILEQLTKSEGLEHYLGAKFPGAKRFSLEGAESLIIFLDQVIQRSGSMGVKEMMLGMAHRGRLNILINIFNKPLKSILHEFEGVKETQGSGDVKYHQGYTNQILIKKSVELNDLSGSSDGMIELSLLPNPSHLEMVTPVVLGAVLAKQDLKKDRAQDQVVPITIHGDASFAGQGVVMETLNMSQTRAYGVGGCIHIIINNQIGFTTSNICDARSSAYCSDIAKMISAPVFHVNADDPEAVYRVAHMAIDYRMRFKKDVFIDLVCYRRHGHNEADDPRVTQPLMYQKIINHPTVRKIYADLLLKNNILTTKEIEDLVISNRNNLDSDSVTESRNYINNYINNNINNNINNIYNNISINLLKKIALECVDVPENFVLHDRVKKIMNDRKQMAMGSLKLDWGFAEILAYASLITQGVGIRFTGQDVRRGTFFHRHIVLHDQKTGDEYALLDQMAHNNQVKAGFYDSLLSESAVLAFEYGYSSEAENTLVIWEAQFGDFVNGAQVVIDQFISAGFQKWDRSTGLVLLLPHGYEGQGPEHSSARLERFLQLCAQDNMQVCVPSNAAQIFHLLRRQATMNIPLVVMSPKSLLRLAQASSDLNDLQGDFQLLIEDLTQGPNIKVQKIILCSGKVYYDLINARDEKKLLDRPIIRLEQLYPFPVDGLKACLKQYENLKEIIFCQEEPKNQGAWHYCQDLIRECLPNIQLSCVARPASAAPAVGDYPTHQRQQQALVDQALI